MSLSYWGNMKESQISTDIEKGVPLSPKLRAWSGPAHRVGPTRAPRGNDEIIPPPSPSVGEVKT